LMVHAEDIGLCDHDNGAEGRSGPLEILPFMIV
jgi:hypothetical protein